MPTYTTLYTALCSAHERVRAVHTQQHKQYIYSRSSLHSLNTVRKTDSIVIKRSLTPTTMEYTEHTSSIFFFLRVLPSFDG